MNSWDYAELGRQVAIIGGGFVCFLLAFIAAVALLKIFGGRRYWGR